MSPSCVVTLKFQLCCWNPLQRSISSKCSYYKSWDGRFTIFNSYKVRNIFFFLHLYILDCPDYKNTFNYKSTLEWTYFGSISESTQTTSCSTKLWFIAYPLRLLSSLSGMKKNQKRYNPQHCSQYLTGSWETFWLFIYERRGERCDEREEVKNLLQNLGDESTDSVSDVCCPHLLGSQCQSLSHFLSVKPTHKHTHIYTHKHMHARTHTYTNTHTLNPPVTFTFTNIFYPRGQFDPSN